jgi:hypothetical protein
MTISRERVAWALNHGESDRISLEFGAGAAMEMHTGAVRKSRLALKLDEPGTPAKVVEPCRWIVLFGLSLTFVAGCDKGPAQPPRIGFPDAGISLVLPAGWQTDPGDPANFHDPENREDHWGTVSEYPLEGKTLNQFIDQLVGGVRTMENVHHFLAGALEKATGRPLESRAIATRMVARTPRTIDGLEAVDVVTAAEFAIRQTFIRRVETVIQVMFRSRQEDFQRLDPAFKCALASIRVNR